MGVFWDRIEGLVEFFLPRLWKGEYLMGSVDGPAEYCIGGTPACAAFLQLLDRNWIKAVPIC